MDVTVKGIKEIEKAMKELGEEAIRDRDLRAGMKKTVGDMIITQLKEAIEPHNVTGNLQRSIGYIKRMKQQKGRPYLVIGPRIRRGQYRKGGDELGYHGHLFEAGSSAFNVSYEGSKVFKKVGDRNEKMSAIYLEKWVLAKLDRELKRKKLR